MNLTAFQKSVEDIGKNLDPDEDWMPVLFLEKGDQRALIALMLMDNNETKDLCAAVMEQIIRVTNPDSACFISTAWITTAKEENKGKYPDYESVEEAYKRGHILPPSLDPDRKEIVIGVCIGIRGENDGQAMMVGEIERSPGKPPRIKDWKIHDDDMVMKGRFADAMHDGFATVDSSGDLSRLNELKGLIDETRDTT